MRWELSDTSMSRSNLTNKLSMASCSGYKTPKTLLALGSTKSVRISSSWRKSSWLSCPEPLSSLLPSPSVKDCPFPLNFLKLGSYASTSKMVRLSSLGSNPNPMSMACKPSLVLPELSMNPEPSPFRWANRGVSLLVETGNPPAVRSSFNSSAEMSLCKCTGARREEMSLLHHHSSTRRFWRICSAIQAFRLVLRPFPNTVLELTPVRRMLSSLRM